MSDAWLSAVRIHAETKRTKALIPVAEARAANSTTENGEQVSRLSLAELMQASGASKDQVRAASRELAQAGLLVELTPAKGKTPATVAHRIPDGLVSHVDLIAKPATAEVREINLTDSQREVADGIYKFVTQASVFGRPTARILRVHGYAGTGKTTVVAAVLRELEAAGVDHIVVAPTGKAAHVLRSKGIPASTVHSALYLPRGEADDGSPEYSVNLDGRATTAVAVVVDECSMVSEQMAWDLADHARYVVAVGDPMQLPPINSDASPWAVVGEHDYELTEILRSDAPDVLDLAHRLRDGKWKPDMVNAHPTRAHGQVNPHDYGAVIVHKNTDRWRLIEQMRGGLHPPQAGDEIMSLANDAAADVVNGQPFRVLALVDTITVPRRVTNTKAGTRVVEAYDYHVLDVEGDDGKARRINVLALGFTGGKKNETAAAKLKRSHKRRRIIPATFGRVLTAHKAQGSEWDRVLVAVDLDSLREVMGPSHAARWLYTAVTRARHQVAVATPDQVDGLG